ncbi:MAG: sugar transferase [Clostridiales bacterium]|nr:sugar transferase [Clostridiales bacterium]
MYNKVFKRLFDIIFSGIAIIILLPFFIIFTPIVAIFMKGNPFFVQERPGKNCKIFKIIKYRTMTNKKDKEGNPLPDIKRLTKFGYFMRKYSIDELPELFNVFKGDMSIVGPRPLAVKYLEYYTEEENKRHFIRPGLTGLAQINGRNNLNWEDRFKYDLEYVNNISFLLDVKIIIKTLLKVITKSNVSIRGTTEIIDFDEYRKKQREGNL